MSEIHKRRRIGRILLRIVSGLLAGVLALVVLVVVALYIPAVQELIRRKVLPVVSEKTGMQLSVERFRLLFPLKLSLEGVKALKSPGDTLLVAGALKVDVALLPLLRQKAVVRQLELDRAAFFMSDTATGLSLRVRLERLALKVDAADLKDKKADIPFVNLDSARMDLVLGRPAPDTTASNPLPDWLIRVARLSLRNVDFLMRDADGAMMVDVRLPDGKVRWCNVGLGAQTVEVKSVELTGGDYAYLTDPGAARMAKERDARTGEISGAPDHDGAAVPAGTENSRIAGSQSGVEDKGASALPADSTGVSLPWTVRVGRVQLKDNSAAYGLASGTPSPGLDLNHLRVRNLDFTADSLFNRGSEVRASIRELSLTERSGAEIRSLSGRFAMDSTGYRISDFQVALPGSEISADAVVGASIAAMSPSTPLTARIRARVSADDVIPLFPLDARIKSTFRGKTLTLETDLSGRLGDLRLAKLAATVPGHLSLTADGVLRSLPDFDRLAGTLNLRGDFPSLAFLKQMLPDTALQRRLMLPAMTLRGNVRMLAGTYEPDIVLAVRGGAVPKYTPRMAPDTLAAKGVTVPYRFLFDSFPADSSARPVTSGSTREVTVPLFAAARDSVPGKTMDDSVKSLRVPYSASFADAAGHGGISATARNVPAGPAGVGRTGLSPRASQPRGAEGTLSLKGSYTLRSERYRAEVACDSFPVWRFLPADSLGLLSFTVKADGQGFDFLSSKTFADLGLKVGRADFRGYDYRDLAVDASLREGRLAATVSGDGPSLKFRFDADGLITPDSQRVTLRGPLTRIDLQELGLITDPIGGSFWLDVFAENSKLNGYSAEVALDSIVIRDRNGDNFIRRTSVVAEIRPQITSAKIRSGDMNFTFTAPLGLDSLTGGITRTMKVLASQLAAGRVDMDSVNRALPPYDLSLRAGQQNILNNFLKTKGMGFRKLDITSSTDAERPFGLGLRVDDFTTAGMMFDTVGMDFQRTGGRLDYRVLVLGLSDRDQSAAKIALDGYLAESTAYLHAVQRDKKGLVGFDIGLRAAYADSALRLSIRPDTLVLGYTDWTANEDNFVTYHLDRRLEADMELTNASNKNQHFIVRSAEQAGFPPGSVRLDISQIGLASTLGMFPGMPPLDGVLNVNLLLGLGNATIASQGDVRIDNFSYAKQRIGNVALAATYQTLPGGQSFGTILSVDGVEALNARGRYMVAAQPAAPEGVTEAGNREGKVAGEEPAGGAQERKRPSREEVGLIAEVDIPGLPLALVNAFLPSEFSRLSGTLTGKIEAEGEPSKLKVDGTLRFKETKVEVPMIGTTFSLSDTPITIEQNRLTLNSLALVAPNGSRLMLDGEVDARDFSRMKADLTARATDFQVINVRKKRGASVFGTANIDLSASVKGPFDALDVQGSVGLLAGTQVTYIMQDSPLELQSKPQNVVEFVNFADSTQVLQADSASRVQIGGMSMLFNVNIAQDVQMSVYLSEDGQNRINLQGGGNLTYTMNPLGDMRFSGKYVLSGGTVRYNPPIISEKIFSITPGGFVEWTGEVADPSFNITAVETLRTSVSSDDGTSRQVNFDISINIRGSLENLSIVFDLAAPDDLTIQNQLQSLTAEQRATQAMSLLVYNTYNGPGTTAKADSANPLNSFIEKELNQWARNSLKGVDLSFGIDTYNQVTAEGESQRTDYSYKLSKNLFGNRVRTVIGGKISSDAEPGQNAADNLIDDISLEYVLTKRDNMFVKIFRHTGYESILEGEIVETGVGFVVRKKMMKLGELFRLSRPKKEKAAEAIVEKADSLMKARAAGAVGDGSGTSGVAADSGKGTADSGKEKKKTRKRDRSAPAEGTLPDPIVKKDE